MKSVLKWASRILGGLVVLLLILGVAFYFVGGSKLNKTYELPDVALNVSDDSAHVARGASLAASLGCTDCHGSDLGGTELFDAPPFRVDPRAVHGNRAYRRCYASQSRNER